MRTRSAMHVALPRSWSLSRSRSWSWASILFSLSAVGIAVAADDDDDPVKGSGKPATEKRELPPATTLQVATAVELDVRVGAAEPLTITGDDNLLPLITTEVLDGRLVIACKSIEGFRSNIGVKVSFGVEKLTEIDLDEEASGEIAGVSGPAFTAKVSGKSEIELAGAVERLRIETKGSADVAAFELKAVDVEVAIKGTAEVEVYASKSLRAKITGAGDVIYAGNPPEVKKDILGVGKVKPKDD